MAKCPAMVGILFFKEARRKKQIFIGILHSQFDILSTALKLIKADISKISSHVILPGKGRKFWNLCKTPFSSFRSKTDVANSRKSLQTCNLFSNSVAISLIHMEYSNQSSPKTLTRDLNPSNVFARTRLVSTSQVSDYAEFSKDRTIYMYCMLSVCLKLFVPRLNGSVRRQAHLRPFVLCSRQTYIAAFECKCLFYMCNTYR